MRVFGRPNSPANAPSSPPTQQVWWGDFFCLFGSYGPYRHTEDVTPTLSEIAAYELRGEGGVRPYHVALRCPAELGQFVATQFTPLDWPEWSGAPLSELLWAFLPALSRRLTTPAPTLSRCLLLPEQQRAAEALSFRLSRDAAALPGFFALPPGTAPEPGPVLTTPAKNYGSLRLRAGVALSGALLLGGGLLLDWAMLAGVGVALLLFLVLALSAVNIRPVQALPAPPPALPLPGPQRALLEAPAVLELRAELEANRQRAEQSSDPLWRYHARAALLEYLPETVALHSARRGTSDDPEFLAALADIRAIALAGAEGGASGGQDWEAHQRFLREKVRSLEE